MAGKHFALNTEPHRITIGDVELLLIPEAVGADFAEAYAQLKQVQKRVKGAGDDIESEDLAAISAAMKSFIRRFLLPESVKVFDGMQLPDRILVAVLEHVAELYGGGSGNDRGGPSSKS